MNATRWILALWVAGLACIRTAPADGTAYVAPGGQHIVPYDSWYNAATSLHDAVATAAASNWTTVLVSNGTYCLSNQVFVNKAMTIRSWNNGALDVPGTIMDCDNYAGKPVSNRAFFLNHSVAVVDGFTITNGNPIPAFSTNHGGAVRIVLGTVQNCMLRHNSAHGGGGVMVDIYKRGVISNCIISENTAYFIGGGIYGCERTEIYDSAILNNLSRSRNAGGVYLYTTTNEYYLRNCTIAGNSQTNTSYSGGGISCMSSARGTIENCVISNNYTGDKGGGMYAAYSTSLVVNCLFAGNRAKNYAGGIYQQNTGTVFQLINCTIAHNTGEGVGALSMAGGVSLAGGAMTNTILYGNALLGGGVSSNYVVSATYTKCGFCCTMQTNVLLPGESHLYTNPLFAAPGAGDFRLSPGSPCINAGANADWMTGASDLDGRRRKDRFSERVDMGAYEHLPRGVLFNLR